MTHTALKLMLLTVVRTGQIRFMRWEQVDFKEALWTLPEETTKMEQPFRVPLPVQAIPLMKRALTWRDKTGYVFSSPKTKSGVLSENAFTQYFNKKDIPATGHGIRSACTDFLMESDICNVELAEMALAHQTKKAVTAAYFRSDMLKKRRVVMQAWADHMCQETRILKINLQQEREVSQYLRALEVTDAANAAKLEFLGPDIVDESWFRDGLEKADTFDDVT